MPVNVGGAFLDRAENTPWHTARRTFYEKPRTTMLIRCSTEEAKRIRAAAQHRSTSISDFVIQTLRRAWKVREAFPVPELPKDDFEIGQVIHAALPVGLIVTGTIKSVLRVPGADRLEFEDQNHKVYFIYPWQVV